MTARPPDPPHTTTTIRTQVRAHTRRRLRWQQLLHAVLISLLLLGAGVPAASATQTPTQAVVGAPVSLAGTSSRAPSVGLSLAPAPRTVNDVPTVVNNARRWLVGIALTVATFFLTLAGVLYMSAGADPSAVEKAKTAFKSALAGYAIAVMAPVFMTILRTVVGVQ